MNCYIHTVPGRVRVKTPMFKGNAARAAEMEQLLRMMPGIGTVETNTVTGSMLVLYDPALLDTGAIIGTFVQKGYIDPSRATTPNRIIESKAQKAGHLISKAVLGAIADKALQGSALSLLTAIL